MVLLLVASPVGLEYNNELLQTELTVLGINANYYIGLPIHCNNQLAHYTSFCQISRSILNRFQPNLQA